MNKCKGCGAFYKDKCPYCGYEQLGVEEELKDKKFMTIIVR